LEFRNADTLKRELQHDAVAFQKPALDQQPPLNGRKRFDFFLMDQKPIFIIQTTRDRRDSILIMSRRAHKKNARTAGAGFRGRGRSRR
jgi:hypothetical protein